MSVSRGARIAGVVSIAAVVAATAALATPAAAAQGQIIGIGSPDVVKDSYVVVLKSTRQTAATLSGKYGGTVTRTYQKALKGFAVSMPEAQARKLAADPAVEFVQVNHIYRVTGVQPNPPSWGIDRIDQRDLPLDKTYTYPNDASTVNAYILDTGIHYSHQTFAGRAVSGFDAIDGGSADDCHGHGTHVAGTVGGLEYGVAKAVKLIGVRVLNCQGSGTTEQVVAGIDWVTQNVAKPAVANMSLGGDADEALDKAVATSITTGGITYAIASGNDDGGDACAKSPARVPEAITVNASNQEDARASFSNIGTCTDIYAPGQGILSSWWTSNTATKTASGTSMAAPHVSGGAALYLAAHPEATPAQVAEALVNNATPDKITDVGESTPNKLLYVGEDGTAPPPPTP